MSKKLKLISLILCLVMLVSFFVGCEADNGNNSKNTESLKSSEGLLYELNDHDNGYIVTKIGACTDTNIVIGDTYEGLPIVAIADDAFAAKFDYKVVCEKITSVTIGKNVTKIGDSAFSWCTNLKSITIADSVTSIGESAFTHCNKLMSIRIPDSVTSIGEYAFSNCKSLTNINIPESVTNIGAWTFKECENLMSISIPESVTSIGGGAFKECDSLTRVYYGGSVDDWDKINIGFNYELKNATRYYYSKSRPTNTTNKYWHYVDDVPTPWGN